MEQQATSNAPVSRFGDVRPADLTIASALLVGAVLGWWWSVRMADDMGSMSMGSGGDMSMGDTMMSARHTMSFAAYVAGWVAMMAAMMFPAIAPTVRLYARAAARGRVAPVPFFVLGYMVVWGAIGVPAYFVWRELASPLADGRHWVARLAGVVFVVAALYQLTPLKERCLDHCRSPISFFVRHGGATIDTPYRAARLGGLHGMFCVGCCWALMAILVAVGTMNLGWMALLTAVIFAEKVLPRGELVARLAAGGFALLGLLLLVEPSHITTIT